MSEAKLRVVLATTNPGKQEEMLSLFAGSPIELVTVTTLPEVEESGSTYAENASRKAQSAAVATGSWALADDSGLEVEALGGRPGVRSARYAGEPSDPAKNRALLLKELRGKPTAYRKARFVCAMALAAPDGTVRLVDGECPGRIGFEEKGEGGFGYDPLFLLMELGKTMAELSAAEKNRISHRAKAAEKVIRLARTLG